MKPSAPRDALVKVLGNIMAGDFGHNLPDSEFWADVDSIIARLAEEGFVIAEAVGQRIDLQHDTLVGALRFGAGSYLIRRIERDPDLKPAF